MDDARIAVQTGVDGVDVVIGTSSFLREHSHGKDMDYIAKAAIEVIEFVKSHNIEIRFSSEDSFRSDLVDLLSIYRTVDKIGVNRVVSSSYSPRIKLSTKHVTHTGKPRVLPTLLDVLLPARSTTSSELSVVSSLAISRLTSTTIPDVPLPTPTALLRLALPTLTPPSSVSVSVTVSPLSVD
jgi:hypothetical protein